MPNEAYKLCANMEEPLRTQRAIMSKLNDEPDDIARERVQTDPALQRIASLQGRCTYYSEFGCVVTAAMGCGLPDGLRKG